MDSARIEHAIDAGANENEEREHEIEHLAAAFACRTRGCLCGVLILLRDFKMHVGFFDAFPHCTEVTPRPNDEEHEKQCQPCVEIERDCLEKQHEAVDLCILREGRTDRSCPARDRSDDADGCRRRIDDVGELGARDLKFIRDRAHDGADGKAVEIVIDEDDDAEQYGDEGGAALALDGARCPLTVGIHRA